MVYVCRRTSQLSISALQELVKGQDGELAVGSEIVSPGYVDLGGITYLLTCILEGYNPDNVHWQWLLGRLYMLDKLIEDSPVDFTIKPHTASPSRVDPGARYDRIMSILNFFKPVLNHSHAKVGRMARRTFYLISKLQANNQGILQEISQLLSDVDQSIQVLLRRRLLKILGEYQVVLQQEQQAVANDDDEISLAPTIETPIASATSTPRCGSPTTSSSPVSSVGLSLIPIVPPNSPHVKFWRVRHPSDNSDADSVSQGSTSSHGAADSGTGSGVISGLVTPPSTPRGPVGSQQAVQTADACVATSPSLRTRRPMHGAGEVCIFPEDIIPEVSLSSEEDRPFFFVDEASYDPERGCLNSVELAQTLKPRAFSSPCKPGTSEPLHIQQDDSVEKSTEPCTDSIELVETLTPSAFSNPYRSDMPVMPESQHNDAICPGDSMSVTHTTSPCPPVARTLSHRHDEHSVSTVPIQSTSAADDSTQEGVSQASVRPINSVPDTGMLTEDLSDLVLSPTGPEERVSFKTEVASRHQLSLGQ